MDIIRIHGPSHLEGETYIQGSKNAALPMMAAAVLNGGQTVLENCPDISDIRTSVEILRSIGCTAELSGNTLTINSSGEIKPYIAPHLMCRLRSSFLFAGALLARCGEVCAALPGGCNIGARPIDIHLESFKRLGAECNIADKDVCCRIDKIKPCDVPLRFPSVGATENVMIFSALSDGVVRIVNAACEPEIKDLQNMLNSMGANISGAGTPVVTVRGVRRLHDAKYGIMPDRIVAATYLTALACTRGCVRLCGASARHISPYVAMLRGCGMNIYTPKDSIIAEKRHRLCGVVRVRTMPYPGFATDMQSLVMASLAVSDAVGVVQENIFENRLCLADTLCKMGADIRIVGKTASVKGVRSLVPVRSDACDLRSGAALAAAMLSAEGTSEIGNLCYIDRGYENFEKCLTSLGAKAERIETGDRR